MKSQSVASTARKTSYSRKLTVWIQIIIYIGTCCMLAVEIFGGHDGLEKGLVSKDLMQVKSANQPFGKKVNG
jgi:hypothetical protein